MPSHGSVNDKGGFKSCARFGIIVSTLSSQETYDVSIDVLYYFLCNYTTSLMRINVDLMSRAATQMADVKKHGSSATSQTQLNAEFCPSLADYPSGLKQNESRLHCG